MHPSSKCELHPDLRPRVAVIVRNLPEPTAPVQMERGLHLSLRVEPDHLEPERARFRETAVNQAVAEPEPLVRRPHPHSLDLPDPRPEPAHSRGAHDVSFRALHDQEHARRAVVLHLPVGDIVVESGGVERLTDMRQVGRQLAPYRLAVTRLHTADQMPIRMIHRTGTHHSSAALTRRILGSSPSARVYSVLVMSEPVRVEKFAVGQSVRRLEDPHLLQGLGRYSDDVNLPRQAHATVVRSPHAHADSIPELEIEANDVRCTHGATVAPVDPEQMFYLMSRGLAPRDAKRLIVEGFLQPVLDRISAKSLRDMVSEKVDQKIASRRL